MLRTGGPQLPYHTIAGVVPCRSGWLVASCKLAGVTMSVEDPQFFTTFADILDYKPAYSAIGVHAPIGYLDTAQPGGRTCDREARAILGARRGASIRSAPPRDVLSGETPIKDARIDAVTRTLLPRYQEISREVPPYRQRTVYEVEPELTFYELNHEFPLTYSKHFEFGRKERRVLLEGRIEGISRILDAVIFGVSPTHLADAAACMWTARRIYGKIGIRVPEDPEWDSEGVRMEILR